MHHPSITYLRLLFPELVSSTHVLNCESCVLAKSHRHSFKLNNTREKTPFALVTLMCGALPRLQEDKVFDIFCCLLMIFRIWLGFIFWKQNQKFLRNLLSSIVLSKPSRTPKFKSLDLITGGNMWNLGCHLSSLKKALSTKLRVHIHQNKMG